MEKLPKYGSPEWGLYQYKRRLEEQRGHNYQWYNHEKWLEMEKKGWQMHDFDDKFDRQAISSESMAQAVVEDYRAKGYYSRIICGYSQNRQRTKMFTVIFKKK